MTTETKRKLPTLEEAEADLLRAALKEAGSVAGAAKILGIDRKTIYRKLQKLKRKRVVLASVAKCHFLSKDTQ